MAVALAEEKVALRTKNRRVDEVAITGYIAAHPGRSGMDRLDELIKQLVEIGGLIGLLIGLVIAAVGWLAKEVVSNLIKAESEKYKSDLKLENDKQILRAKDELARGMEHYKLELEAVAKSDDRIRTEILTWANPILEAVNGLESRLRNILTTKGFEALDPRFSSPQWSVTYEYFLNSTLFLFGQYFCWTNMLHQELSFELFRSQKEMKDFFATVDRVNAKLSDFPPFFGAQEIEYEGSGSDTQVFRLQQRAIGEILATRRGNRRACRSYAVFLSKLTDKDFSKAFDPVRQLVDAIKPEERRWKRLQDTLSALVELKRECSRLLQLPAR
jgi:hypothetical protein